MRYFVSHTADPSQSFVVRWALRYLHPSGKAEGPFSGRQHGVAFVVQNRYSEKDVAPFSEKLICALEGFSFKLKLMVNTLPMPLSHFR